LKAEDFELCFFLLEVGEGYAEIDESNAPENFRRRNFADSPFHRQLQCSKMN
jgi:hypothetical protein